MPKRYVEPDSPPECPRDPLGLSPDILAKRAFVKPAIWGPKNIEYDPWCDPDNPKTILPKDVYKAATVTNEDMPATPLVKSKYCAEMGLELYYKLECFNRSHSYLERGASYALQMLNDTEMRDGVYTAALGNWGKALALKARRFRIPLTVVVPEMTSSDIVDKIKSFGATVVCHGMNLAQAKKQAFVLKNENGCGTYISGYDHPHVIAASGVIGIEVLEKLPQTDAILVQVGGGALLAGITTVVKQAKPEILVYGLEPHKCCSFFKAMENERPYRTECEFSLAGSLAVPHVGVNAYHTAVSLVDKMVLIDEDRITQAILHLAEVEKYVVDGTGAMGLSAVLSKPTILPELLGKTVVCILTGSCMDNNRFCVVMERALAIEGRKIYLTVKLGAEDMKTRWKIFSMIANVGANILTMDTENISFTETDVQNVYLNLVCETRDVAHACTLKRVLTRIFPNICEFLEEPFSPIPICICSPKKRIIM